MKLSPFRMWIWFRLTSWLPETRCYAFKAALLRWCGAQVGKDVRIVSGASFAGNGELVLGDDVFIGRGCRIVPVGAASIRIGSHIDFGPEVMVLTGSHEIDVQGEHIGGRGIQQSVQVGDGCWLGARSVILPGVILAPKTMVAAGAVVTKSIVDAGALAAGVPAKIKRSYL